MSPITEVIITDNSNEYSLGNIYKNISNCNFLKDSKQIPHGKLLIYARTTADMCPIVKIDFADKKAIVIFNYAVEKNKFVASKENIEAVHAVINKYIERKLASNLIPAKYIMIDAENICNDKVAEKVIFQFGTGIYSFSGWAGYVPTGNTLNGVNICFLGFNDIVIKGFINTPEFVELFIKSKTLHMLRPSEEEFGWSVFCKIIETTNCNRSIESTPTEWGAYNKFATTNYSYTASPRFSKEFFGKLNKILKNKRFNQEKYEPKAEDGGKSTELPFPSLTSLQKKSINVSGDMVVEVDDLIRDGYMLTISVQLSGINGQYIRDNKNGFRVAMYGKVLDHFESQFKIDIDCIRTFVKHGFLWVIVPESLKFDTVELEEVKEFFFLKSNFIHADRELIRVVEVASC